MNSTEEDAKLIWLKLCNGRGRSSIVVCNTDEEKTEPTHSMPIENDNNSRCAQPCKDSKNPELARSNAEGAKPNLAKE